VSVDSEDTQPDPCNGEREAPRLARDDSFVRALVKLQAATDALGAAIVASDAAAAAAAASDACSFLLTAIAVFRGLAASEEAQRETSRIDVARYGLRTNHRALEDLFARAQAQLPSDDLRRMLDELRIALTLALGGIGGPRHCGWR
jgi:hypothetical protein